MKLLEHFKELSLYPKNTEELKGLILQLAVEGKLTVNWRKENPGIKDASELFDQVRTHNIELLQSKKRKVKKKALEDNLILDVPDTWIQVKNQDLFTLQKGKNPKDLSERVMKYPYQDIEALDRGNIRRYSNDEKAPKCTDEDILVVCDGSRSGLVLNGRAGIVGSTLAIIETPKFIQEYVKILFLQDYKRANANMKGAAIPHLDTNVLLATDVGFPPLEEQNAIVELVNNLFAEVEQLESLTKERIQLKESFVVSALTRLTEAENTQKEWNFLQQHFSSFFTEKKNIKSLRETILQLAVQGKLTESWRANNPNTEPASELLKRIEAEKQKLITDKKIKKEKPLSAVGEDEMPYELPVGWGWCRFGKLISFLNGYAFKSSTYVPSSNYQVIRLGNVKNDKFLVNTKEAYVPKIIGDKANGYKLYKDDILTTLTGTKNKRDYCFTCLVKNEHLEERILLLNQRVGCIRAVDKSTSELMNMFLKAEPILDQLFATETGTVNQGNIGSTAFKNLVFPLPPIQEQRAIVEKVNSLMALSDQLEEAITLKEEQTALLMQSCVAVALA